MSRVFISYRRADSARWANALYGHVSLRFGQDLVFEDIDDIKPGQDFLETIRRELAACQAFLVLIGPRWLVDAQGRRRIDHPNDILRMEVVEALSGTGVVLPVLVGGAAMPAAGALPDPLKPLCRRQAVRLTDEAWAREVEALIDRLREIVLPTAGEVPLPDAQQELYEMQVRYFDLLDNKRAAEALDLAQKTQAYLDRVLPLYPQDATLKVTRGYAYKNEAMALGRLGRHDEAGAALARSESIFRTMLEERPRDAGAWNGLGSVESLRGNDEKAHEYVDKALEILPDYPAALEDHRQLLERLGKTTCGVPNRRRAGARSGLPRERPRARPPSGERKTMTRVATKSRWRSRVPWVTKLRPDLKPKVVASPRGTGTMLVPTPLLVAEELRRVRSGRLITPSALRERLARRFGADQTCPLTTGIMLHIVAGASEELIAAGKRPIGPYWRVVDEKGGLNPKWAPGPQVQAAHLRREGHRIRRPAGSERWQVVGFDPHACPREHPPRAGRGPAALASRRRMS